MELVKLATEFFQVISLRGSQSKHTLEAYTRDISRFLSFCAEEGIVEVSDVDKFVVMNYMKKLKDGSITSTKLTNRSFSRMISAIKSLFNYYNEVYDSTFNPTIGIKAPKIEKKLPEFLTYDQMMSVLNAVEEDNLRDRSILELFYACGLRLNEVSQLKMQHINFNENYVLVHGKGDKERIVPFYPRCASYLRRYIEEERKSDGSNSVFLSNRCKPLSNRAIQLIVEKYGLIACLPMRLYPHMIRHTFATHLLDNGADILFVSLLLGHQRLETTQIYTHVTMERLKQVVEKYHPSSK